MNKITDNIEYKTDPRVLKMLAILYARNYIVIGKDEVFEKLLKELEEENDNSIV